ncbi:MAG TPA: hypothetical protein VG603_00385, partial [Chitinophagales bacterium]|nr:hypothetical protein [Chitinophagales bacterium]
MKNLILLFCLCPALVFAQKKTGNAKMPVINETITKANLAKLKTAEDSLQILSDAFLNDSLANNRKKACYAFIPKLVKALEVDNSFFYPFDSVAAISQLYPPDSSFRILSWQLFTSI